MCIVGNDIVDRQKKISSKHFATKILSTKENKIFKSSNGELHIFSFWACKEAAYKALRQIPEFSEQNIKFIDFKKIEVNFVNNTIIFLETTLNFNLVVTENYINCICCAGDVDIGRVQSRVELRELFDSDESAAVRKLAKKMLCELFELNYVDIFFTKNSSGAPCLINSPFFDDFAFSFSHHKNYVSVAILAKTGKNK